MKIGFTAKKYIEKDDSVTLSLREIDIIENGETEEKTKEKLAEAILEYAEDFKPLSSGKNLESNVSIVSAVKNMTIDNIKKIIKIE